MKTHNTPVGQLLLLAHLTAEESEAQRNESFFDRGAGFLHSLSQLWLEIHDPLSTWDFLQGFQLSFHLWSKEQAFNMVLHFLPSLSSFHLQDDAWRGPSGPCIALPLSPWPPGLLPIHPQLLRTSSALAAIKNTPQTGWLEQQAFIRLQF